MISESKSTPELSPAENAGPLSAAIGDCAVYILDRDGQIVSWNPVAERLTGYSAAEVVGERFSVLHTPEDRDARVPQRELIAASAGCYAGRGERVRKDGSRFLVSVAVSPLRDRAGSLVGFANVIRDLTEQKTTEARVRTLRRVAEALNVRDEFLLAAKRELHSAVTAIQVNLQAIERVELPFDAESAGVIKAKAAMLGWGLDRAITTIGHIVQLANHAAAQLSTMSDPTGRPVRRPVPETD